MSIYPTLKYLYTILPGKAHIYKIISNVYTPSYQIAGYLKFRGGFNLNLGEGHSLKIFNDFCTLPSIIFWRGMNGYEEYSLKVWLELSKHASSTIDLGANFGLFGLITKAVKPDSEVIFVEPLERNVKRIERNLKLNHFKAKVIESATGDDTGNVTFYDMDSNENTIGSIDENFVRSHDHATRIIPIKVAMTTVDELCRAEGLSHVDLIKIDVEGADYITLLGAVETVSRFEPNILIEITNDENAQKIQDLIEGLQVKYYFYEIDEDKGLSLHQQLKREGDTRNYLFSTMDHQSLLQTFPDLN